jgi:hypothetical protein
VAQLVEEKLIVVSERESPARVNEEIPSPTALPYTTPELKTYRDMGDLLALDPPLPGMREIPWHATDQKPLA